MNVTPSLESFTASWRAGKHQVVWTRLVSDLETPVSAMLKLGQGRAYSFLLESIEGGEVRGRYSIIGREPDLIWRCQGGKSEINRAAAGNPDVFTHSSDKPLDDLRELLAACRIDDPDQPKPMAAGLFGYLGYDMVRLMERIPEAKPSDFTVPDAVLVRPTLLAIFDQIENCFTLVTPAWFDADVSADAAYAAALERLARALADLNGVIPLRLVESKYKSPSPQPLSPPRGVEGQDRADVKDSFQQSAQGGAPRPLLRGRGGWGEGDSKPVVTTTSSNMTEDHFVGMVERAKDYIRAGDIFQVVLSQRFRQPFDLPPFSLYRAIRRLDPSPFLFFFDLKDFSVVGSSPEILVRVRDGKVTIRPIAGTRPRGIGNRSDAELAAELLADPKELAEHLMLLDLGRNDVGRVAKIGSVKVTARNAVEYYRHVMHIVSNVEGELADGCTELEALIGGFPAGTVSGSPKIRAMEIIAELEPDKRGVYAGCIGYFGANGSMDSCIAIRTAVVKDGALHVQAGAGIVYDSDPHSEYRETAAKARGLLRAAEVARDEAGG